MLRHLTLIAFGMLLCASLGQKAAVSRQLANVVGATDDRRSIVEVGLKLGLSAAEVSQIRNSVGLVSCGGKFAWATGFLIRDDLVVTVAHVLRSKTGEAVAPLKDCFFRTQGDNPDRHHYFSENEGDFIFGSLNPAAKAEWNDYVILRLVAPVQGAKPLKVLHKPVTLAPEDKMFVVPAYREEPYYRGESTTEPLIQHCGVRRIFLPFETVRPSVIYSDCDSTRGASGAPNIMRIGGELVVVSMFKGAGFAKFDYKPYNEVEDEISAALSLALDFGFLRDISRMLLGPS